MSQENASSMLSKIKWDPLGLWNVYFLFKLGLFYFSYIEIHVLENIAFIAFLAFPVGRGLGYQVKHAMGFVIALLLLHHDSYLPPLSLLMGNNDLLMSFSPAYLLELVLRVVSLEAAALILVTLVTYLYFNQWIRFTGVNILALFAVSIIGTSAQQSTTPIATQPNRIVKQTPVLPANNTLMPATDPASALANFYSEQQSLVTEFPEQFIGPDFDVVILNICSLGWDDLNHIGMENHPLLNQFDVIFENFNSATSYSGPAATRLLNSSCGQRPHDGLYGNKPEECNLFAQLEQLGFQTDLAMNHNGFFDSFLQLINTEGGLSAPLQSLEGINVIQRSFDGSPIYSDRQVLNKWLDNRARSSQARHALYFNSISLHDGNIIAGQANRFNTIDNYKARAQALMNDIDGFFEALSDTNKNYLVIMVPEHGAALKGDQMQFSGLREIPTPSIVNVPVGIKFISPNKREVVRPVKNSEPLSYFAISEFIARTIEDNPFNNANINIRSLLSNLPTSAMVAENENSKMILYSDQPYIQLDNGMWTKYPN
jgi:cellulose synthase operon protein YhjU